MDSSILSEKYKIPEKCIEKLDASVKRLSPTYSTVHLEEVLKSFLKLGIFSKENQQYCSDVNFVTPSECKFINSQEKSLKLGTWSFKSHSKNKNDILIGYLELLPSHGVILLRDKSYKIPCAIACNETSSISAYIDKCVIVINYTVFTESYNIPNLNDCEFIFFKIHDVAVVNSNLLGPAEPENKRCKEICTTSLRCRIIRKSPVCLSQICNPEIWFEIEVIIPDQSPKNELLCLGLNLIKEGVLLEKGKEYIFFFSKPCELYTNYEIKRFRPNLPSRRINDASFFVETINSHKDTRDVVLNLDQAFANLKTMSYGTIISFQGKLHNKKLVRPNSSRTQSANVAGFGTPGLDTHVLEFNCKDGQQFILYLNNWERNAKPLGLIPEMEILVRDVAVQSNRYYKSTVFTDFEVKDYGRNVILNSVHLDPQENMPSRKINDASFFVETINSLKDSRDVVLNSDQATANLKEEKSHSEGISASKENSSNSKNRKTDCGSGTRFAEVLDMLQSISSSKVRRKEKNSTPLNSENYNSHELKAKSYGTIIPFQEKLHNKKLVRPNSSTTQSANIAGFRTSSLFTHVLVFNCKDEQEFNVYLNYWDRNSDPLSLIPEIKTLVRDVAVQSNRYYKSTALTDFEVKVDGRNIILIPVNLPPQENIKIGIDRPTFLGYGHKLPERITIFARFSEIEIRSLRIKISCSNCLTIYCSCGNADITVNLMCFVFDGFGKAVLIANDLEFLRLVLHISQYSWNSWCKGFKLYGPFNYNGQCSPEETGVHDRDMFAKKLYTLITIINRGVTNSYSINVKCRKIVRKHDPQHEYLPMFYCLKARRSSRHQ